MIDSKILDSSVQDFIDENLKSDLNQLILKGSPFEEIDIKDLAVQIKSKRKAEKKLPSWFKSDNIIYPPGLNLEQSSSEKTAQYKASLVSGKLLIDITGGFGVDSYFFSQKTDKVIHCELNQNLSDVAKHNFQILSAKENIEFKVLDGLEYLKTITEKADWIYLDPGRRSAEGKKVFLLEQTQPNILEHIDFLLTKSKKIMLKTSPLLDLALTISQLRNVEQLHIVSIKNEVKELIFIINKNSTTSALIKTINISKKKTEKFSGFLEEEKNASPEYGLPLSYLYIPNASILKAGFFKKVAQDFNVKKLSVHTHLYTSEDPVVFPGRIFKIKEVFAARKKELKKRGISQANIAVRNFPGKAEQLKKKFGIKDGGEDFLFFTQNLHQQKIVIWARKHKMEESFLK